MHNLAATVSAMSVNDPPTISGNGAAIAPRPAGGAELVSDDFPVFHWRHDARGSYSCITASNDHRDSAPWRKAASLFRIGALEDFVGLVMVDEETRPHGN
jgi:hypothetical protein